MPSFKSAYLPTPDLQAEALLWCCLASVRLADSLPP